ncbi:MAG: n-acetylglutamate synthase [Bacteroidetes bacterium]|nr:n-acetylglutamate synthase [Bacteroidota bacterium]
MIDYDGKVFVLVSSTSNGDAEEETTFQYHQHEDLVCGTYSGGTVRFGSFVAVADEAGVLDLRYQHLNVAGELMTGICRSVPEVLADGRIRLYESWRWTCGDGSAGESVVEEIE